VQRLEEQYRDTGLKVIWIGFQDKKDKVIEFLAKHGVQASLGYDRQDRISRKYGIRYGAGIALIDRDGNVRRRIPKGISEKALKENIEFVLHAPPAKLKTGSSRSSVPR